MSFTTPRAARLGVIQMATHMAYMGIHIKDLDKLLANLIFQAINEPITPILSST